MARETMTDEEVEMEIERLQQSEAVKLARLEQQIRYKRRQYLYQLRWMEKKGEEMLSKGITRDQILTGMWEEIQSDL